MSAPATTGVRARQGVWAIDRNQIYIAPWLQSTETAVLKWDGIKRVYADADPIDDDPQLRLAVEEYIRWQHAAKFDHDMEEAARAREAYESARALLMHECREETRARGCEPSLARGTPGSLTSLFYNEEQQATASCPDGQTGNPVTVTIQAGSVASNTSVADANNLAKNQAQNQANARLVCSTPTADFTNDSDATAVATCVGEDGAPTPEGDPVVITIPKGTVHATTQAQANTDALALAQSTAAGRLECTFWNKAVTVSVQCPSGGPLVTKTVAAHTWSSTFSQADADARATTDATTQANAVCANKFFNTLQTVGPTAFPCQYAGSDGRIRFCTINLTVYVPANYLSSTVSLNDANTQARNQGSAYAVKAAFDSCRQGACHGVPAVNISVNVPPLT